MTSPNTDPTTYALKETEARIDRIRYYGERFSDVQWVSWLRDLHAQLQLVLLDSEQLKHCSTCDVDCCDGAE